MDPLLCDAVAMLDIVSAWSRVYAETGHGGGGSRAPRQCSIQEMVRALWHEPRMIHARLESRTARSPAWRHRQRQPDNAFVTTSYSPTVLASPGKLGLRGTQCHCATTSSRSRSLHVSSTDAPNQNTRRPPSACAGAVILGPKVCPYR